MSVLTRDLPSSIGDLAYGWTVRAKREYVINKRENEIKQDDDHFDSPIALTQETQGVSRRA